MLFNKKIINFSAITVYSGLIFFFLIILLSDVRLTSNAFLEILNFENFLNYDNIFPIITVAGTPGGGFGIHCGTTLLCINPVVKVGLG